jgi:hypothetical protein
MRIFTSKQDVRKYVDLLVASKDSPLFDVFVRDTWFSINRAFPGLRAEFFEALRENGLFDVYVKRVKQLLLSE